MTFIFDFICVLFAADIAGIIYAIIAKLQFTNKLVKIFYPELEE
jgi:hypothetical protein